MDLRKNLIDRIRVANSKEVGVRLNPIEVRIVAAAICGKNVASKNKEESDFESANVHIRWMIRRDMPEVLAIEKSGRNTWGEDEFIRCLRQRNCIGMVAEYDDKIVGFMIYELHKNQIHVLNFAVCKANRRRSIGSQMVRKLAGKMSLQRRNKVVFDVNETNTTGLVFLRESGFVSCSYSDEEIEMVMHFKDVNSV